MREYKTVTYEHRKLEKVQCDLCKQTNNSLNWSKRPFDLDKTVTILHESGRNRYPEGGGEATLTEIDICPNCFTTKLLPWLVSQSVNPPVTEIED